MTEIPINLLRQEFRYIKLGKEYSDYAKVPIEKDCLKSNNYNFFEMTSWLDENSNNNYGIVTGNLIVLDFDNEDFQNLFIDKLPETFIVLSANKKLRHYYYLTENPFKTIRIDINKKRVLDIICQGNYIVGAGSLNNGNIYEILFDVPLATITESEIRDIFKDYIIDKPSVKYLPNSNSSKNNKCDCIDVIHIIGKSFRVTKEDQINYYGIDPRYGITKPNKFNFSITKDRLHWYSFHSSKGGNAIELLIYLLDCSSIDAIYIIKENYHKLNNYRNIKCIK